MVGQTVLDRLLESHIWHLPASSVARWWNGSKKWQWPLTAFLSVESCPPDCALMPDIPGSPCMSLVSFNLLSWCWRSEGVSMNKSLCGLFKKNSLGLQKFLLPTQSLLVFAARNYGDLSSWSWIPGLECLVWGCPLIDFTLLISNQVASYHSSLLRYHSQNLSTTHRCGTSLSCVSTSPTSLDGCGFFNSVVFRLPFNLISDSSEWWLFCILVVIFIWLCEEVSCVYLCRHLDHKPLISYPLKSCVL